MLFPTFTFILGFLPLTIIVYYLLAEQSHISARIWLIAASFVFYSWFNWSYFFILASSILVNHLFAVMLYRNRSKTVFITGVIFNILLLGYFKYYDFFVENINALFGTSWTLKHILLPLGISFFTFQQISFLQQIYNNTLSKCYSFSSYSLFVSFFPQLIAGPIVLPNEMMSQFEKEENYRPKMENIAAGIYVFSLGLAKKILLADFFAVIADAGFVNCGGNFFQAWRTALAYTFQIYFDFSGYCDMAIGIALLFNIQLPVNFNSPYLAANISDFWRKWHITLGRFLMTSIYIPLGGNRVGKFRNCCNLLLTFFISGLWHGASWLFVLWGMLHGAALVLHRIWSKFLGFSMPLLPARILTFIFVLLAWVPFRAANWGQAQRLYSAMFAPDSWNWGTLAPEYYLLFAAGTIIVFAGKPVCVLLKNFRPSWSRTVLAAALITVSMFFFVKYSPFIYFNF
ncbi:MAG: MBOAT family protein [Lentisphaeria bacterium]|nr:MBOAT family protein [Lentisphaeria bacterium]